MKLMWSVKRSWGERMWVKVTEREGDRLVGTIDNWPVFAYLSPDEKVKLHIDDIIDCMFEGEVEEATAA